MTQAPAILASSDRHRVAILVLGMHRSGTSALTWLIGQMGAALPKDAIVASAENSTGYWESAGLVAADEQLIRAAGSSWFDPRALDLSRVPPALLADRLQGIRTAIEHAWGEAPLLAIKDPRQCRFVPTLTGQLGELGIAARAILMLRGASEVAASILRRDGTIASYGLLLWLRHMLDAELETRALPRVIIRYDSLLADWRATAGRVAPLLGREGWAPKDGGAELDAFINPDLRHQRGGKATPVTAQPFPPDALPDPLPDPDADAELIRRSGLFDVDWYRSTYPEAAASELDPVVHYLRIGAPLGYDPNPLFHTSYYARQMARRDAGRTAR